MTSASKLIQASAGNAAGAGLAVEEVFSTYLYEGNGSTQTITNDIDLSGEGGLVWIKNRDATDSHVLTDTERGATEILSSDSNAAEATDADTLTAFNSDGFAIGADVKVNTNTEDYVSWTFRKAPKFFDVVTYTGDGTLGRAINHNLGSTPGMVAIKGTSSGNWVLWHRSAGNTVGRFNSTAAFSAGEFNTALGAAPNDTTFTVGGSSANDANNNGQVFVAYLFAHNDGDGEFGESGDQDIIKCGSYTGTGSAGLEVDLGFEPQWILLKNTTDAVNWYIFDVMRGIVTGGNDAMLSPNASTAETGTGDRLDVYANGFRVTSTSNAWNGSGDNFIYIAIRRGPMKTPESGTEVFAPNDVDNGASAPDSLSGFPVDMYFRRYVNTSNDTYLLSRLTGTGAMKTNATDAEVSFSTASAGFDYNNGVMNIFSTNNADFHTWMFRRAPGFFDVVAYEGNGSTTQDVSHNLGVVPEMIWFKNRDGVVNWGVYHKDLNGGTTPEQYFIYLSLNASTQGPLTSIFNNTAPTSSAFSVGFNGVTNTNANSYIAYLFATLPGVSKVGSYTGNGTSQTIDCGFSAGARFVMTKRTNTTGNWNVWDSERGIIAGNDPRLELNTTDAEDTGHDYIDPDSSGFVVNYVADDDDDSNVSGDTYIFLAIA